MSSLLFMPRMRVGDVFAFEGRDRVVIRVNESGAKTIPLARKEVTVVPLVGNPVTFTREEGSMTISANSLVTIKQRLGENWRTKIQTETKPVVPAAVTQGEQQQQTEEEDMKRGTMAKTTVRGKGEMSRTAFIDSLYLEGGLTQKEIHSRTMRRFPDCDSDACMNTVKARPSHIKRAGKVAKWEKETKEAAANE